jgi:Uma2 family endonuclease
MATTTMPRPKARRLWTYDELAATVPETNQPTELWDGELIMSPAPRPSHQEIVMQVARRLQDFVTAHDLGKIFISPCDVVLTQRRTVQPDVIYVSRARQAIIQDNIQGVPDLVVEVISEGSWRRDRIDKKALYEQFGLPEYWIIDPEARTIEVFVLTEGAYRLHTRASDAQSVSSRLLAGFSVSFSHLRNLG